MINKESEYPFLATSFFENAEMNLVSNLLHFKPFEDPKLQRLLASYPIAIESEKEIIIIELMESLWKEKQPAKLFKIFRDFDSVFSILGDKGHFIHQFEVFLLGWTIIRHIYNFDKTNFLKTKYKDLETIFYLWLKASSAHDFGYPLQVINKLSKEFSNLYKSIFMDKISEEFKKISKKDFLNEDSLFYVMAYSSKSGKTEQFDIKNFIINSIKDSIDGDIDYATFLYEKLICTKKPHAIISALIFTKSYINYLSDSKLWDYNNDYYKQTMIIASSIALHSIHSVNRSLIKSLSFTKNPIAYLLFVTDNLQEWNRALRRNENYPVFSLAEFNFNRGVLSLIYHLNHFSWPPNVKRNAVTYVDNQRELFRNISRPAPNFNFKIHVEFKSNIDLRIAPINIEL